MKKSLIILLVPLFIMTGCQGKAPATTQEMVEEIHNTPVIELPLKKELGEQRFNALTSMAALSIQALYDFPSTVSVEQRLKVIDDIFLPVQKDAAVQRAKEVSNTYQQCLISLQGVKDAKAGTFQNLVSYRVLMNTKISTEKGIESVVFEIVLVVTEEDALRVYWVAPLK